MTRERDGDSSAVAARKRPSRWIAALVAAPLIAAGGAWGLVRAQEWQRRQPALRHYRQGIQLEREGKAEEALDAWQAAIDREPDWLEPYVKQADLLESSGMQVAAIGVLRQALDNNPKGPHLACRIAELCLATEDPVASGQWSTVAIRGEPKCARAHVIYARTHQADLGVVMSHLRTARDLAPADRSILVRLAKTQAEAGELREAEETMKAAPALGPLDADCHFVLGMAVARRARDEETRREAEKHLREAIRLAPDRHDARAELGMLYERFRDWTKARDAFEEASRLNPYAPAILHHLSTVYRRLGDKRAKSTLDRLAALQAKTRRWRDLRSRMSKRPQDLDLAADTAEAALELGAHVFATSLTRSVLQRDPTHKKARRLLSELEKDAAP